MMRSALLLPALALLRGCLATWEPGYWDVGSHDGTMPKCDYQKYPSDPFNPDDFAATGHGCDQFPLRLCGHDENLWPGGAHHDNISCYAYTKPSVPTWPKCILKGGFMDPACLNSQSLADYEASCKIPDSNVTNPNCNIDIKRDCYCLHKELFPLLEREMLASMVFVLGVFIAACAGIGGGGLNVPFFIILFGFLIKEATPLSHAAVMANSAAQFIINWRSRHTETDQPVTDYIAPLVLLPAQLAGNNLGVLFSPVIPADVLYIMSIGLLLLVTAKVFYKAVQAFKAEAALVRAKTVAADSEKLMSDVSLESRVTQLASQACPGPQTRPLSIQVSHGPQKHELLIPVPPGAPPELLRGQTLSEDPGLDAQCEQYLSGYLSVHRMGAAVSVGIWAVFSVFYVALKEADKCSGSYWGWFVGMYLFLIAAVFAGVRIAMHEDGKAQQLVQAGVLQLYPSYVQWDYSMVSLYGSISVAIGFVGGILGLGGAEFMAPLMLEMGMLPARAAATAAYMNMFTSASNIIHYTQISGTLPQDYTLYFCCLSFLAGLTGRSISTMISNTGRQSVVVFALSGVLGTSAVLLLYRLATEDSQWGSKGFCSS